MTLLDFAGFLAGVSVVGGLLGVWLVNVVEKERAREREAGARHAAE